MIYLCRNAVAHFEDWKDIEQDIILVSDCYEAISSDDERKPDKHTSNG
jgi:hypothetical protein